MRKWLLLSICAVFGTFALADDKKDDKPTVRAISISVNRKVDRKLSEELLAGKIGHGTEVALLVRCPGKPLLRPDRWNKLTVKDDKGTLLNDPKNLVKLNLFLMPETAFDRSATIAPVRLEGLPAKGATKVRLEGELVVLCGTDVKTIERKKFDFGEGGKAKLGEFASRVTKLKGRYRENGEDKVGGPEIQVSGNAMLENVVKGLEVKDGDGNAVEVIRGSGSGLGALTGASFYVLTKPLKEGSVTLSYFARSEEVKLPVDVTIGLGE